MAMAFNTLESLIVRWAFDKGIMDKSNPLRQFSKTMSELNEVHDAMIAKTQDPEEDKDAIGDTTVTLVIQAAMHGLTAEHCYYIMLDQNPTGKLEILDKGETFNRMLHEVEDLHEAILNEDVMGIEMHIGNMIHLLKSYCRFFDFEYTAAVEHAYNIISKRTGRMVNGMFVKDRP
jgi:hypothetical protein